jgi:hypothetical protein
MADKADFDKLNVFKREGIQSIDPRKPLNKNSIKEIPQTVDTVKSKRVLEKWSIYVNPSYRHALKIYAARNNRTSSSIINEALEMFIEKRNVKE